MSDTAAPDSDLIRSSQPTLGEDWLVEIRDVSKRYGSVQALRDVSFNVASGEVVVLIGPSGSGKSSLLRCINHLEELDSGKIRVAGQYIGYEERNGRLVPLNERKSALQRAKIGTVFQHFNLFNHKTALENVMEGPVQVLDRNRAEVEAEAAKLLERVGLGDKLRTYPAHLSGGQQQRVAIARALAMKPELLLFDEPTSALDPETIGEVLNVMKELVEAGMTMIVSTHEMGFAREAADKVVMMDQGQVIEVGAPGDIFGNARSRRTRDFLNRLF